jgi:helicase SWR1
MDKQCEDRAHRIGQIRDVHIYRFVSQHTVEEAMLRKANQKRSLDDIVIQKGAFDWRTIFSNDEDDVSDRKSQAVAVLTKALGEFEDVEDAHAAAIAAREEYAMEGADNDDFGAETNENVENTKSQSRTVISGSDQVEERSGEAVVNLMDTEVGEEEQEDEEEGGTVVDYMLTVVQREYDGFFKDWRL